MDNVRIGFVGAGEMANKVHYPSLSEMPDAEIVAICDLDESRSRATAEMYGVPHTFTDYQAMIRQVEMDAIYIILNPEHLFKPVMDALEAGLNLFIEKPPALTLDQTVKMAVTADKKSCKSLVAFNRRYIPVMRRAKSAVEEKGEITQAVATFYKHIDNGRAYHTWPYDILRYDAIHALDTLRWMGGEVRQVSSLVRTYNTEVPNAFNAVMEFESGATGVLLTNWSTGKRVHTFELHGNGVSAFVNPDESAVIHKDKSGPGEVVTAADAAGSDEFYHYYGYFAENRHFIDCLKEDRQPETSLSDAVKTMELADRIYQHSM